MRPSDQVLRKLCCENPFSYILFKFLFPSLIGKFLAKLFIVSSFPVKECELTLRHLSFKNLTSQTHFPSAFLVMVT